MCNEEYKIFVIKLGQNFWRLDLDPDLSHLSGGLSHSLCKNLGPISQRDLTLAKFLAKSGT